MQFLNPLALFGLFALVIPLVIHLFNFKKPKRVFFSNVKFLRELKLESRKRSQLKHLLVLLMRLGVFVSLVFAFAMPVIVKKDENVMKGKPLVMVFLDNSYSMQSYGKSGVLFEAAVKKATEIAGYYSPSDEFLLITNDFSPKYSRVVNRSDFLTLVTSTRLSSVSRSAGEVFERIEDARKRNPGRNLVLFIVSDFQTSTLNFMASSPPADIRTFLIPLQREGLHNLYVDSVWMDVPVIRPGQVVDFWVKVGNSGEAAAEEIPLSLALNGKEAALATLTIPASGSASVKLTTRIPSEGIYHGVISIEDNPVIFDDKFHLGVRVSERRNVLLLNGDNQDIHLTRLFSSDSLFRFDARPSTQIDYASLNRYDIIFCNGLKEMSSGMKDAFSSFVEGGGALVVFPATTGKEPQPVNVLLDAMGIATYGVLDTTDVRVSSVNFEHPVYKGVYTEKPANLAMPMVYNHYPVISKGTGNETWVIRMLNDRPLISAGTFGKGVVYLFATGLGNTSTNLASHAELFVPPVYNMALYSGVVSPLYYILGNDLSVSVPWEGETGESAFRISDINSDFEFIPGQRNDPFGVLLFFEDQVSQAGNYKVSVNDTVIAPLAFNFPHHESDLKFDDEKSLRAWINDEGHSAVSILSGTGKSLTDKLQDVFEGKRLWKYFVIAALAFLLAETLILRFWKTRQPKTR